MKRPAIVIAAALLGLVGLWVVLLLPSDPDRRANLGVDAAASPSPTPADDITGALPTTTAGPAATNSTHPSTTATSQATASASAQAGPQSTKGVPATGTTTAPRPRATATTASYAFAPKATASGQAPSVDMRFSDLSLHSGQRVTGAFTMNAPGSVEFDAHTASSSAASGSYPTSALLACLEFVGQAPCRPVATPQPGYWAVTAADLARHTKYQVRILATADSSLLAGIRLGWRGPRSLRVEGLRLQGGCQAAVGKGYAPGCGLKYKFVVPRALDFTTTTATPGLQISLKNTVTNAKAYSGPLVSPQHIAVPAAGEWSGHLYPADGTPVAVLVFTMNWN